MNKKKVHAIGPKLTLLCGTRDTGQPTFIGKRASQYVTCRRCLAALKRRPKS